MRMVQSACPQATADNGPPGPSEGKANSERVKTTYAGLGKDSKDIGGPLGPEHTLERAPTHPLPGFLLADSRTESTFDEIPVM